MDSRENELIERILTAIQNTAQWKFLSQLMEEWEELQHNIQEAAPHLDAVRAEQLRSYLNELQNQEQSSEDTNENSVKEKDSRDVNVHKYVAPLVAAVPLAAGAAGAAGAGAAGAGLAAGTAGAGAAGTAGSLGAGLAAGTAGAGAAGAGAAGLAGTGKAAGAAGASGLLGVISRIGGTLNTVGRAISILSGRGALGDFGRSLSSTGQFLSDVAGKRMQQKQDKVLERVIERVPDKSEPKQDKIEPIHTPNVPKPEEMRPMFHSGPQSLDVQLQKREEEKVEPIHRPDVPKAYDRENEKHEDEEYDVELLKKILESLDDEQINALIKHLEDLDDNDNSKDNDNADKDVKEKDDRSQSKRVDKHFAGPVGEARGAGYAGRARGSEAIGQQKKQGPVAGPQAHGPEVQQPMKQSKDEEIEEKTLLGSKEEHEDEEQDIELLKRLLQHLEDESDDEKKERDEDEHDEDKEDKGRDESERKEEVDEEREEEEFNPEKHQAGPFSSFIPSHAAVGSRGRKNDIRGNSSVQKHSARNGQREVDYRHLLSEVLHAVLNDVLVPDGNTLTLDTVNSIRRNIGLPEIAGPKKSSREASVDRDIERLKKENAELRAMYMREKRRGIFTNMVNEGYQLDVDEELSITSNMDDKQFVDYVNRIRKYYRKAPVSELNTNFIGLRSDKITQDMRDKAIEYATLKNISFEKALVELYGVK